MEIQEYQNDIYWQSMIGNNDLAYNTEHAYELLVAFTVSFPENVRQCKYHEFRALVEDEEIEFKNYISNLKGKP